MIFINGFLCLLGLIVRDISRRSEVRRRAREWYLFPLPSSLVSMNCLHLSTKNLLLSNILSCSYYLQVLVGSSSPLSFKPTINISEVLPHFLLVFIYSSVPASYCCTSLHIHLFKVQCPKRTIHSHKSAVQLELVDEGWAQLDIFTSCSGS